MDSLPLISVCIPTYNSGHFIHKTLESVLNQYYENMEVIITDDGSNDNTVEIINSFSDKRIKLLMNEKTLGLEANWNKALRLATGKYCKMMGADDIIYPYCISEQAAILDAFDVALVTSHKNIIDQNGTLIFTRRFPGRGRIDGIEALKKSLHRGTNVIGEPVAGLFRKDVLEKSGYYNGENPYMIDLDFWSRILKNGDLYVIDKVLYAFRISPQSLSAKIGFAQRAFFDKFVDKVSADEKFQMSAYDRTLAKTMAMAMGVVRNLTYLIYFRKNTPTNFCSTDET
jgi:glycosyltransferase involved in cell wall biosynthesis